MVDYTDPCAVLEVLRPVYYSLLSGSQAETIEFEAGNGTRRKVTYTAVKLEALRSEISRLESACAAKQGKRVRRFGLRAGGEIIR